MSQIDEFEKKYLRFLLGESSPEEEAEIALDTLDDELYEEMELIEDDLVTNYLRGHLTPSEVTLFEKNYLGSTPERNNRIILTKALLAKVERLVEDEVSEPVYEIPAVAGSVISGWRLFLEGAAAGALVGILIAGVAGYLFFWRPGPPANIEQTRRIEELEAEQRNAAVKIETLEAERQNAAARMKELAEENETLTDRLQKLPRSTPELAIKTPKSTPPRPGLNDSEIPDIPVGPALLGPEGNPPFPVPRNVTRVRLNVPIGEKPAGNYRLMVNGYPADSSRIVDFRGQRQLQFTIPARQLKNGSNMMILFKLEKTGPIQQDGYSVQIEKIR